MYPNPEIDPKENERLRREGQREEGLACLTWALLIIGLCPLIDCLIYMENPASFHEQAYKPNHKHK